MVKKTQFFQLMEIEEVEKIDAKFVLKHLDDLKQNEPIRNLIIEVPFFSNHFNNSNSFTILQERFHHERRCDRICQIFCQSQHSISDSGRRIWSKTWRNSLFKSVKSQKGWRCWNDQSICQCGCGKFNSGLYFWDTKYKIIKKKKTKITYSDLDEDLLAILKILAKRKHLASLDLSVVMNLTPFSILDLNLDFSPTKYKGGQEWELYSCRIDGHWPISCQKSQSHGDQARGEPIKSWGVSASSKMLIKINETGNCFQLCWKCDVVPSINHQHQPEEFEFGGWFLLLSDLQYSRLFAYFG